MSCAVVCQKFAFMHLRNTLLALYVSMRSGLRFHALKCYGYYLARGAITRRYPAAGRSAFQWRRMTNGWPDRRLGQSPRQTWPDSAPGAPPPPPTHGTRQTDDRLVSSGGGAGGCGEVHCVRWNKIQLPLNFKIAVKWLSFDVIWKD